ncbi:hypothetical protein L345_17012, partial [Ophiophagus hannah]
MENGSLDSFLRHPIHQLATTLSLQVIQSVEEGYRFTQTLSERSHIDFTHCGSVEEWLDSIRLGRYQENFALGGYSSLGMVMHMNIEDVQNLGISLTGHQRKILTSIQIMRSQLLNTMGCRRPL